MKSKTSNRWPERSVEAFFDNWSENMAYVLGYFAADGTMYKNRRGSCYVAFTSTDKELIELIKRLMNASNASKNFIEILQKKIATLADVSHGRLYFHSRAYELVYHNKDVVKLYRFMYPESNLPSLKRKRKILEKGIRSYGIEVYRFARLPVTE